MFQNIQFIAIAIVLASIVTIIAGKESKALGALLQV